jgi:hypothetical protein
MGDRIMSESKIAGPGMRRIAKALGLPERTTRTAIERGEGPAFKLAGRWFARPADWAPLLTPNNRKPEPTPEPEPEPKPAPRRRRRVYNARM